MTCPKFTAKEWWDQGGGPCPKGHVPRVVTYNPANCPVRAVFQSRRSCISSVWVLPVLQVINYPEVLQGFPPGHPWNVKRLQIGIPAVARAIREILSKCLSLMHVSSVPSNLGIKIGTRRQLSVLFSHWPFVFSTLLVLRGLLIYKSGPKTHAKIKFRILVTTPQNFNIYA